MPADPAPAPPTPTLKDTNRRIAQLAAVADKLKQRARTAHAMAAAADAAVAAAVKAWRDAVLAVGPDGSDVSGEDDANETEETLP